MVMYPCIVVKVMITCKACHRHAVAHLPTGGYFDKGNNNVEDACSVTLLPLDSLRSLV